MSISLKQEITEVRESIIGLYLDVKIRSNEELAALDDNILAQEKKDLKGINTLMIVDYIRSSIETLLNLKNEESNYSSINYASGNTQQSNIQKKQGNKNKEQNIRETPLSEIEDLLKLDRQSCRSTTSMNTEQSPSAYEEQMQKYEQDIRTHISIEQQLKIYIDNIKYKLECLEKEQEIKEKDHEEQVNVIQDDKKRFEELLNLKEKEIKVLQTRVTEYENKIVMFQKSTKQIEDQSKQQMTKMQKEMDQMKSKFQNNINEKNQEQYQSNQYISASQGYQFNCIQNEKQDKNNGKSKENNKKKEQSISFNKQNTKQSRQVNSSLSHYQISGMKDKKSNQNQQHQLCTKTNNTSEMISLSKSILQDRRNTNIHNGKNTPQIVNKQGVKSLKKNQSEYFIPLNKDQETNMVKKGSIKSPERIQLYKLTQQKYFEKLAHPESIQASNRTSIERNNLSRQQSQSSMIKPHHRRSKTGNNQWINLIGNHIKINNSSISHSRDCSQTIGKTGSHIAINSLLQNPSTFDTEENLQPQIPFLNIKEGNQGFNSINDNQIDDCQSTVEDKYHNVQQIQNIKSMQNMKATGLNQQKNSNQTLIKDSSLNKLILNEKGQQREGIQQADQIIG